MNYDNFPSFSSEGTNPLLVDSIGLINEKRRETGFRVRTTLPCQLCCHLAVYGLSLRKHKGKEKMYSGSFDTLTGVPALRPCEDERKKARTRCLSKPASTEKLSIKVIYTLCALARTSHPC